MLSKLGFKAVFCLFLSLFSLTLPGVGIWADEEGADNVRGPNQVRLAAWNIKFLGGGFFGWAPRRKAELEYIAKIITRYDFIAITEVMPNTAELEKVLEILSDMGYNYRSLVTEASGLGYYRERYAFLYRDDVIKLVDKGEFYPDKDIDNNGKDDFSRDPYWATFQAGNFDFTVIVVHIKAGDMKIDPQKENVLLDTVYVDVQEANGKEEDVLLVGDFNMRCYKELGRGKFDELRKNIVPEVSALFHWEDGHRTNTRNNQLYDNIFFQKDNLHEYADNSGVFCFDEHLCKDVTNKELLFRLLDHISDHRPVWADFKTDLEDDD